MCIVHVKWCDVMKWKIVEHGAKWKVSRRKEIRVNAIDKVTVTAHTSNRKFLFFISSGGELCELCWKFFFFLHHFLHMTHDKSHFTQLQQRNIFILFLFVFFFSQTNIVIFISFIYSEIPFRQEFILSVNNICRIHSAFFFLSLFDFISLYVVVLPLFQFHSKEPSSE